MNQKYTGGPAFPNVPDGAGDKWQDWDQGISQRDYFAAHAPAMPKDFDRKGRKVDRIIDEPGGRKRFAQVQEWETPAQQHARWVLEFADAVLALRGEQ